jgi:hypothetical protein
LFTEASSVLQCVLHTGCFDYEEQAARAYDKMMLWCELHGMVSAKGGHYNFDVHEYDKDVPWLSNLTQVGHSSRPTCLLPLTVVSPDVLLSRALLC